MNSKEISKENIFKEQRFIIENTLPFYEESIFENIDPLTNEKSLKEIYKECLLLKDYSYESLTIEEKNIMANLYFRQVIKERLRLFVKNLKEEYDQDYTIRYFTELEKNLTKEGITGSFEVSNNKKIIMISMYVNNEYSTIKNKKAYLNTKLTGLLMLSILHEFEHLMQFEGQVNRKLKKAIDSFESKCEDAIYYYENYYKDPKELDANLYSFKKFISLSSVYLINDYEEIIRYKVLSAKTISSDNLNVYKNLNQTSIKDIIIYLEKELNNSIDEYNCKELERVS